MNTCGLCDHWRLEGPLAKHGYGHCAVRPNTMTVLGPVDMRPSVTTSEQATCRIGRFEAKKQGDAATPTENAKKELAA